MKETELHQKMIIPLFNVNLEEPVHLYIDKNCPDYWLQGVLKMGTKSVILRPRTSSAVSSILVARIVN